MDTNVNSEVDMDLLVDNQPDEEKDYLDNVNKEPVEQNPDPDKVVEADLGMTPAEAATERLRKVEMMRIGLNPYTKSLEKIEVVDKAFEQFTDFKTWNDFHSSPADKYAKEAMKKIFKESPTIKPVTMTYYKKFEKEFNKFIFGTKLFDFKNKYMSEYMDKTVSVRISDKYYGTVSLDINFKKKGVVTPVAATWALVFNDGKCSGLPIVPLMKVYEGCGSEYTSTESYRDAYSLEKAFGYFKKSDFRNAPGLKKYHNIDSINDFFNFPIVKEKVKDFLNDIKEKGLVPVTIEETKNLKSTFFNKFIRGTTGSSLSSIMVQYIKKYDVVWAYWFIKYPVDFRLSVVGLVKTPKGKMTSIGFAISVPTRPTAPIENGDKKSKESFDFRNGVFDFGL